METFSPVSGVTKTSAFPQRFIYYFDLGWLIIVSAFFFCLVVTWSKLSFVLVSGTFQQQPWKCTGLLLLSGGSTICFIFCIFFLFETFTVTLTSEVMHLFPLLLVGWLLVILNSWPSTDVNAELAWLKLLIVADLVFFNHCAAAQYCTVLHSFQDKSFIWIWAGHVLH